MSIPSTTREHLIEVGLAQLRLTGYTATGVKEVLERAQVPKGSFYHYFPSKELFVEELLKRYGEEETQRAQHILGDEKVPPLKRLRAHFEDLIALYGRKGDSRGCLIGAMALEVADHMPRLRVQLKSMYAVWQSEVARVLRQAIDHGELSKSIKPDSLAEFIISSYEGALIRMKAEQDDRPLQYFLLYIFGELLEK